jgi:hypothetical protein
MVKPKDISFDCYGTLTHVQMSNLARILPKDRIPADKRDAVMRAASTAATTNPIHSGVKAEIKGISGLPALVGQLWLDCKRQCASLRSQI